jgi:hypothetical protein
MSVTDIGAPISSILPPGIRAGRSGNYTVVDTASVSVAVVGTTNQVVLQTREVRLGVFGRETVEEYQVHAGAFSAARSFMNDCLRDERCCDCRRKGGNGETIIIEVTWAYDREDSTWIPGSDKPLWGFDIIETSQPLMSHPYFGRRYIAGGGADMDTLLTEMGRCDQSLANFARCSGVSSPARTRVHCTARNRSGTSASGSRVSSITTG